MLVFALLTRLGFVIKENQFELRLAALHNTNYNARGQLQCGLVETFNSRLRV